MNSRERVKTVFERSGVPDRVPLQFDLCRQLIDQFGLLQDTQTCRIGHANQFNNASGFITAQRTVGHNANLKFFVKNLGNNPLFLID